MKILYVIEGLQESCGISKFVIEIVRELHSNGELAAILTAKNWNVIADDITIFQANNPEALAKEFRPDVVHIHGCWNMYVHRMALWCRKNNVYYVFSPHGAWTQWAWQYHHLKKWIAWHLYQRRDANGAAAFHVTVDDEAADVKRLRLSQPIYIAPLGVSIPNERRMIPTVDQHDKVLLYLGRIHPKKNLHGLLEAWKKIPSDTQNGWELIIAGKPSPGQDSYHAKLKKIATKNVSFVGEIVGSEKERLYQISKCFILPSFSENFGSVVLEALINGTPVITTTGTPWSNIVEQKCGWQCEPTVEAIQETLIKAMSMSESSLIDMGQRGRQFAYENYSWRHSSQILINAYQKILDK